MLFVREIEKLKAQLVLMFQMVEQSFTLACKALSKGDLDAAAEVVRKEPEIDEKRVDIQEECFKIIALHQPVASDLRFIIAALKFNNDLERIADLAESLAERARVLADRTAHAPPFDADAMAGHVHSMLSRSLDALIKLDQDLAMAVLEDEDEVDAMHRRNYDIIKAQIKKRPDDIDMLISYLSISRYLERVADYSTNLAEEVVYIVKGEIIHTE